ncbi:MAG: CIA30 family protein [Granulosicoccus sp.]
MMLFDFTDELAIEQWQAVDDRVMGGVSQSELLKASPPQVSLAIFRGTVSNRNNGGFCSVRATLDKPVPAVAEHLSITCQNSMQWGSKSYYLNLRTNGEFDGVSYRTGFTPNENLTRHEFTALEFAAVFRGRPVSTAPPLAFTDVRQIGLMIADAQLGPFELGIGQIDAF